MLIFLFIYLSEDIYNHNNRTIDYLDTFYVAEFVKLFNKQISSRPDLFRVGSSV
jgi:hypothetical protein